MTTIAERYRRVAAAFTERVDAVPAGAWDNAAPCEGWVARDVVRHLTEWIPAYFQSSAGLAFPPVPPVDDDPAASWRVIDDTLQSFLDDRDIASREFDSPIGRRTVEDAIASICLGDVLIHTWDVARATGLDETLDADEVHAMYAGMEPFDEPMRASGHFGPRVPVPDDADEQTKLIAFTGRQP